MTNATNPALFWGTQDIFPTISGFGTEESYTGTALGLLEFEHFVVFGTPMEIEVLLTGSTAAKANDSLPDGAVHEALAQVVLNWEGIVDVRDGLGNPITAHTLTSGTGIDWAQPVPEPGVAPGLAIGTLAMLGGSRFRRRRLALRSALLVPQ